MKATENWGFISPVSSRNNYAVYSAAAYTIGTDVACCFS
jgi:hypothetical protein